MIVRAYYQTASGRIIRVVKGPADHMGTTVEAGVAYIDGTDQDVTPYTHWVTGGAVALRTALTAVWDKTAITADGVDYATLSPLPASITVMVGGTPYAVAGGSFEFAASDPGAYVVSVDHLPYLPYEWILYAD